VDALHTDTRNLWAGSIMAVQPVFMGGSIIAMNKMADLGEQMASNQHEARLQAVLYATDHAYWQVVSLKHKKLLAEGYLKLVKKLDSDVQKMIQEGVATRSEGLSVSVKVNEAEMAVQKVNDGLVLSKMLLCQMVGLPLDGNITLADEDSDQLAVGNGQSSAAEDATAEAFHSMNAADNPVDNRPELKVLENVVDLTKQTTNLLRAGNLPQVALTGGYAVSNPNVLNGFQRKFGGFWNVGVLMRIPLWNWGDVMYKVRASKGATAIASLELADAREKIGLQVNQSRFKVAEAGKRMTMAQTSIKRADENLRTANLGFREGVISPTVVMEAQTAWLQAQSQKIDAEIDMKLSQVDLRKAMGVLKIEN
jgi:outer membrane protein TolC